MKSSHHARTLLQASDPKLARLAIRPACAATLLLICLASPLQAAITWTGDLDPADPTTWTTTAAGYIGKTATGTITVDDASALWSKYGHLGYDSGSDGTVTVTGIGSTWTNIDILQIGDNGNGTLNIQAGGQVNSYRGALGVFSGSTGTATVTGAGSTWTNKSNGTYAELYVGDFGNGILNIEAGGQVSDENGYLGLNSDSIGTATVTGTGSKWINSLDLFVGRDGSGTLTVNDGGTVEVGGNIYASSKNLLGNGTISANGGILDADLVFDAAHGSESLLTFGSGGILTITSSASSKLGVGYKGSGTLRVTEGANIVSKSGDLGRNPGSSGTATVTGANSKWTTSDGIDIGSLGTGTLNIEAGGQVNSSSCYLGGRFDATGTATVSGSGSKWINSGKLVIGDYGTGSLKIEAGGLVNNTDGYLANYAGSSGTVTVTGEGSKWINSGKLEIGYKGSGALNILAGGQVSNTSSQLGYNFDSSGKVTVSGAGSKWINNSIEVGYYGTGSLSIEASGLVNSVSGAIIGMNSGSSGTVTVTGAGSQWNISGSLDVGYNGIGTLNIGNGIATDGLVSAKSINLAGSNAEAICNLNGGTLQISSISKGPGAATFNWSDGSIRNYDASTDLSFVGWRPLTLQLATTGTHAFYIDAGRKGTVSAILSDATSGGTLEKQGDGLLTLSAANTYTGGTTISAGTLALTSTGSLASSPIDVKSGATFNVSVKSGYSIDAGKKLTGSGTIIGGLSVSGIHAPGNSTGVETVKGNYSLLGELQIELAGTTAGTSYDEVLISGSSAYNATLSGTLSLDWTSFTGSTDATQLWIVKNDTAGTLSGAFSNYANGASLGFHDGRSWNLYYNADASTGNLTGGNDVLIAPVPEPATIVLLALSALAALLWRRKSRVGQA